MKILVTYQSKTGFTKKYAEWIAQALDCEIKALSTVKAEETGQYELIIHGGWLMGGLISGLKKVNSFSPRRLIVFGVGLTPKSEEYSAFLAKTNKLSESALYYYEGGIDPNKMGFMGRWVVKLVSKKTPVYTDNTNREEINELVKYVLSIKTE